MMNIQSWIVLGVATASIILNLNLIGWYLYAVKREKAGLDALGFDEETTVVQNYWVQYEASNAESYRQGREDGYEHAQHEAYLASLEDEEGE